ncbi:hypothetical protein ACHAO8_002424 [Botrytis cinerea]
MSADTVHVKNISSQTSEKEVKDFFSFCGKIISLEVGSVGETQNATVQFEKETAAKTALLLDNTQLGSTQVKVTSASGSYEDDGSHYTSNEQRDSDDITQEEKPRSRIIAEYLAHGYTIGDTAAQRAIDLDQKHGVSSRFLATLNSLDSKYNATEKAKGVDQSYGVSQKASSLLSGLTSYYEKAAGTPTGQKLVNFYTQTSRQVQDIHAEARRLADIKKQEGPQKVPGTEKTTSTVASPMSRRFQALIKQLAVATVTPRNVAALLVNAAATPVPRPKRRKLLVATRQHVNVVETAKTVPVRKVNVLALDVANRSISLSDPAAVVDSTKVAPLDSQSEKSSFA